MYCENHTRYPVKTMLELFPDKVFPMDTADDRSRSEHCYYSNIHLWVHLYTAGQARDLLDKMLKIDPYHRCTVDGALRHPYVNIWWDKSEVDAVSSLYSVPYILYSVLYILYSVLYILYSVLY